MVKGGPIELDGCSPLTGEHWPLNNIDNQEDICSGRFCGTLKKKKEKEKKKKLENSKIE